MAHVDWTLLWEINSVVWYECYNCDIRTKSIFGICQNYDYMHTDNSVKLVCVKCIIKHNPYIDDHRYTQYGCMFNTLILYGEITARNHTRQNPNPEYKKLMEKQLPNRKL